MIDQIGRSPWLRKAADNRINHTFAQPSWHPAIHVADTHAEVAAVPAEQFIAAQTGQSHLDETGSRLTYVVAWNHGIVGKGLIERCHDVLNDVCNVRFN